MDETGSMISCKGATVSGFNEYIKGIRKEKILFTLTRFNTDGIKRAHTNTPIKDVKNLTNESYKPTACTNLYDAIGQTIQDVKKKKGDEVLCIIMTDGEENASKEFTLEGVNKLMDEKKKAGWTFVYLGADHDAWDVGQKFGLSRDNVARYSKSKTVDTMSVLCANTVSYGGATANFFSADQKRKVGEK